MSKWLVYLKCPIHSIPPSDYPLAKPYERVWRKYVIVQVSAPTEVHAPDKVIGYTFTCPYAPHKFKVEPSHIIAVSSDPPPETARLFKVKNRLGQPGVTCFGALEPEVKPPPLPEGTTSHTLIQHNERVGLTKGLSTGERGQKIEYIKFVSPNKSSHHMVFVTLNRGRETFTVNIPVGTVAVYDQLMNIAKQLGSFDVKTAILAFLVAYGSGSKSLVTGFLQVSGFTELETETVGQALSRYQTDNMIYRATSPFELQLQPPSLEPKHTAKISKPLYTIPKDRRYVSMLGEPVYYILDTSRNTILTMLKNKRIFKWWSLITPKSINIVLKTFSRYRLGYDWIRTVKITPPFITLEDHKSYGSIHVDKTLKLPAISAYVLVKKGLAQYLDLGREQKKTVEKKISLLDSIFTEQELQKIYVQMGLGFF